MHIEPTTQEKIDYIYERMKKEEQRSKIKLFSRWMFRLMIIMYFVYLYNYTLPALKQSFYDAMTPNISIENSETFEKIKSLIDKNL